MTDSRALDADRLPWLTNDVKPAARGGISIVAVGAAALLLVAGGAYWAGRTLEVPAEDATWTEVSESVQLPDPIVEQAAPAVPVGSTTPPQVEVEREQPKVAPAGPTVSERAAVRPERKASSPVKRKTAAKRSASVKRTVAKASSKPAPAKTPVREAAWPKPSDAVPLGRIIRIGTYSTPQKNHKAWQVALRRYPQMQGLPKIIGVYRDKRGRTLYPLYVMTNARAQSDWLCRKMKRDWRRCTVIA